MEKDVLKGLYDTFDKIIKGEKVSQNYVKMITKTADSIYRQRIASVREREVCLKEKEFKNIK